MFRQTDDSSVAFAQGMPTKERVGIVIHVQVTADCFVVKLPEGMGSGNGVLVGLVLDVWDPVKFNREET